VYLWTLFGLFWKLSKILQFWFKQTSPKKIKIFQQWIFTISFEMFNCACWYDDSVIMTVCMCLCSGAASVHQWRVHRWFSWNQETVWVRTAETADRRVHATSVTSSFNCRTFCFTDVIVLLCNKMKCVNYHKLKLTKLPCLWVNTVYR